jgi:hypothetical protein
MIRAFISILFLLSALPAQAGLLLDQNLFYYTNAMNTSATESYQHYHVSMSVSASIPKDYFLGWKSTFFSDTQQGSAGTMKVASGLEMGPRAGMYFTKSHWTSVAVTYLPIHKATYTSDTGTVSTLSGSGFEFELAFHPDVTTVLCPGFSLLYHLGSYSSSTSSTNTISDVSYTRNGFYPSIYLHWKFGDE